MNLSITLIENEKEIIATCPELDINCYGYSREQALRRMEAVIDFYLESSREIGLEVDETFELTVRE